MLEAEWTSSGPAWLFCPADRPDRYAKALLAADVVILDLEDAVAPDRKDIARTLVRSLAADYRMDVNRTVIRINAADSPEHAADLRLVEDVGIRMVMLAKAETAESLRGVGCDVIALIESVRGVRDVDALTATPNVVGLMWGADDLTASMGGTSSRRGDGRYRDLARFARAQVLVAAKARGLFALDAVHMNIPDLVGLAAECEDAVALGFDATVAIHPSQVPAIRAAYRPESAQIDWAHRLLSHVGDDRGVTTFEGRMVDGPIYKQAERILQLAGATANAERLS